MTFENLSFKDHERVERQRHAHHLLWPVKTYQNQGNAHTTQGTDL